MINRLESELQALNNQQSQLNKVLNTFSEDSPERYKVELEIKKNDVEIRKRLKQLKVI